MKLTVILPGDYGEELCEHRQRYLSTLLSPGAEVKIVTTGGTPSLTSIVDLALIAPGMVNRTMEAEKGGFDGVLIHWMFDMGVQSARAAVNIPVVGLGSATYHIASQLADRFGLISTNEKTVPEHRRRIRSMGFSDQMVSMKALNIPILESIGRKEELEDQFIKIAQYQISAQGAELIISGSGSIFPALGPGSRERIEKKLGVPVLEGSGIALRTLELLVNLRLTQSKKSYPSPCEKLNREWVSCHAISGEASDIARIGKN